MRDEGHADAKPGHVRLFFDLFKLRIGFAIGLTALAGALAVPAAGRRPGRWHSSSPA